jgi:hypothetical protein
MSRYDRKARNFLAFTGIRGLVTQTKKTINRMKIYGEADIVTRQGRYMDMTGHSDPQYIRIKPKRNGVGELMNLSL